MIGGNDFPHLTAQNHRATSPPSTDYNCVAWSAADTEHGWQPGVYWPVGIEPDDYGLVCSHGSSRQWAMSPATVIASNPGSRKSRFMRPRHFTPTPGASFPTAAGRASSADSEDIEHETPNDLAGGVYGDVLQFMKRSVSRGGSQSQ